MSKEKAEFKTSDSKLKSLEKCFTDRTPDNEPPMNKALKLKSWPMVLVTLPLKKLELTANSIRDERFPRLEGKEPLNKFSERARVCRCSCSPNQGGMGLISSLLTNLKDLRFRRFNKLFGT